MFMGKIIYMNTTLSLFNEESIQALVKNSDIKYLEDSFYLILKEPEE